MSIPFDADHAIDRARRQIERALQANQCHPAPWLRFLYRGSRSNTSPALYGRSFRAP